MVELMVAVVIGMVGMVALFQLSKMAEGQRRSTIRGSDAQSNGMRPITPPARRPPCPRFPSLR